MVTKNLKITTKNYYNMEQRNEPQIQ